MPNGVVVLCANARMQRSNDMFFPFEQEGNFLYLTNINEPDWLYVLDNDRGKSWLIAPDVTDTHQTFDGSLSPAEAKRLSSADTVLNMKEGDELLQRLARKHSVVYTIGEHPHRAYFNFVENPAQANLRKKLAGIFASVQDCRKELAAERAIKRPDEIKKIQRAIDLTIDSFKSIRAGMDDFRFEYEVEAEFSYRFRRKNADHAYDPIVAAGANACTLHYVENSHAINKHQLVLIDVGARVDGYAADITRTYAKAEPTKRQQAIHSEVAAAHQEIINKLEPGLSVSEYHDFVDQTMKRALRNLKLLNNVNDSDAYRKYFPHAISHGLGVDVHDSLGGAREFASGMVLTVEPGIYVSEEGIGIRIEDDILITDTGSRNMSSKLSTDW